MSYSHNRSSMIRFAPMAAALVAAALLAIPSAGAEGQTEGQQQGPQRMRMRMPSGPSAFTFPEGKDVVRIPFTTIGEHIVLPVSVNGSPPLRTVLDTGMPAPGIVLHHGPHMKDLSLDIDSGMRAAVGGAGGHGKRIEAKIADGANIAIGEVEFPDSRVIALPEMDHFPAFHDGIIGAALFGTFTVRLDVDRGMLELHRQGTFKPSDKAVAIPMELENNLPYIMADVVVGDGPASRERLVVDLGAMHAVSLNATSSDGIRIPDAAVSTTIGRGISGAMHGHVGRITSINLGGFELHNVVATFPDPEFENPRGLDSRNGNLGVGILGRFNVTFDYDGKKMYLEPTRRLEEAFEWDMSGMVLDPVGADLRISEVIEGSAAAKAGLRPDDLLIGLDGKEITATAIGELRSAMREEGATVSVRVRRGDETLDRKLKLHRLL